MITEEDGALDGADLLKGKKENTNNNSSNSKNPKTFNISQEVDMDEM